MIRFLQTPGRLKKYILSGILLVTCVSIAWYLGNPLGTSSTTATGVVATVAGEDIHATDVQAQAKRLLAERYPRGGPELAILMPLAAQRAFDNLVNEKILIVEARPLGLKATDDDLP